MTGGDPLIGSRWSEPGTVAGFTASAPNATVMRFAGERLARSRRRLVLDIGCGAGRNAVPLAAQGWTVVGLDLSRPMLAAARQRAHEQRVDTSVHALLAPMDRLPIADARGDLIIAHGIWNLAASSTEFRAAVREAARVASADAALFVFTFSRHTLPPATTPVAGEEFVFTQFSGDPQCFLTEDQLKEELGAAGFVPDPELPLRELNVRPAGMLPGPGPPVILEGGFLRRVP